MFNASKSDSLIKKFFALLFICSLCQSYYTYYQAIHFNNPDFDTSLKGLNWSHLVE